MTGWLTSKPLPVRQVLVVLAPDSHDPLLTRVVCANATSAGEVIVRGTIHIQRRCLCGQNEALRTLMARVAPSWQEPTEQGGTSVLNNGVVPPSHHIQDLCPSDGRMVHASMA